MYGGYACLVDIDYRIVKVAIRFEVQRTFFETEHATTNATHQNASVACENGAVHNRMVFLRYIHRCEHISFRIPSPCFGGCRDKKVSVTVAQEYLDVRIRHFIYSCLSVRGNFYYLSSVSATYEFTFCTFSKGIQSV